MAVGKSWRELCRYQAGWLAFQGRRALPLMLPGQGQTGHVCRQGMLWNTGPVLCVSSEDSELTASGLEKADRPIFIIEFSPHVVEP